MKIKKPTSTNPADYEILIRKRGIGEYASYCPQLNYMLKGTAHEEVKERMKEYIEIYINSLSNS
ncbi:MAG: hypothetical protein ABSG15_09420 [FCB group bacterium]|jgi:predicted RNase H-like HicB family nuclease